MPQRRIVRVTGNRFNRRGQVITDRRRYYDWGDDYEPGFPLRPSHSTSPAKRDYRAARTARRARKQAA